MAADEIERFRRDILERGGADAHDLRTGGEIDDATLLREVMNTVGKKGRLGEQIRCVVSVSMLTEGWDANTVTHVLGVRAFGTQLLCEQVVGRGLAPPVLRTERGWPLRRRVCRRARHPVRFRREAGHRGAGEAARDGSGARGQAGPRCAGDRLPRVEGYRVELPDERLEATFGPDHVLHLTPELVGPSRT